MPSEIIWMLKSLGFTTIDFYGAKLGTFGRENPLTTEDFEMLVIAKNNNNIFYRYYRASIPTTAEESNRCSRLKELIKKLLWSTPNTYLGNVMVLDSPIEKLTTAVFGFALAVGALSLTKANPETVGDILSGLVLFTLSFIILVVIWWGTSDIMSRINHAKPVTILLNIILLFFVAIEPYLLNILNANQELFPLSSTLYGIDMAFLMGLSAALSHILIKENTASLSAQERRHYSIGRNNQLVCAGLFFISLIPQFLEWNIAGMSVRVLIWFATLAVSLIISSRNRIK